MLVYPDGEHGAALRVMLVLAIQRVTPQHFVRIHLEGHSITIKFAEWQV